MKRRFFSILLTLALCVGLLPVAAAPVHADAAEAYDLWIGGVQVTSENAADLSVIEGVDVVSGGEANYDAATNTLTLNGATIIDSASAVTDENYTQADGAIVYTGNEDFTINAIGGDSVVTGADTMRHHSAGLFIGMPDNVWYYSFSEASPSFKVNINISEDASLTFKGGVSSNTNYPSSYGI
ncbi:MAG: hypothetical protein IKN20_06370, partial [Firmicutes bacterium]|nr:hypothetical protein [Bacillota bacterium]